MLPFFYICISNQTLGLSLGVDIAFKGIIFLVIPFFMPNTLYFQAFKRYYICMEIREKIEYLERNHMAIGIDEWGFISSLIDFFKKRNYLTEKQMYYVDDYVDMVEARMEHLEELKNQIKEIDGYLLTNEKVVYTTDVEPCFTTRVTHIETGESYVFTTRNVFDFGHVVNPAYPVIEGADEGGLAVNENGTWWWHDFVDKVGWQPVRPLGTIEQDCYLVIREHSFSDKELMM